MTTNAVTIIYHADCSDGFGAAYAAWHSFGERADYCPMHHGEAWDSAALSGHDVFILDFSFPPEQLTALAAVARSVTQIDHHLSAHQAWADLLQPGANQLEAYHAANSRLSVSCHKFKRPSYPDFLSGNLTCHGKKGQGFWPSLFSTRLNASRPVR